MNFRVSRRWWVSIGTTVVLLALAWVVGTALAQEPGPEGAAELQEDVSLAAMVADKINYQGRLTDSVGAPLNGTFPMQFQIYDDATLGTMLWDSGTISVDVDHGLFNVELAVDPTDFNGQALWLRIYVDGDWLSPRQELVPVPYALSLRPGAEVQGPPPVPDGAVLDVEVDGFFTNGKAVLATTATGSAIFGDSAGGFGLRGYSENGNAVSTYSNAKTAGVFHSNEGYGIRVNTDGTHHYDHAGYFTSNMGYGVYAQSTENMGVRAEAGNVSGLSQAAGPVGVLGMGESGGVFASSGTSYGVYAITQSGTAVRGTSDSGDLIELHDGSPSNRRFRVDNAGNVYADGWYRGAGYLIGNADFAEMVLPGEEDLLPGDVLAIGSDGRMVRSSEPYETTVAGIYSTEPGFVAGSRLDEEGNPLEPEAIPLAVVGIVPVNVSAENGSIEPGDLLVASSTVGHAMRAGANPPVGTVLGKALEPLEAGTASILVLVTLQ